MLVWSFIIVDATLETLDRLDVLKDIAERFKGGVQSQKKERGAQSQEKEDKDKEYVKFLNDQSRVFEVAFADAVNDKMDEAVVLKEKNDKTRYYYSIQSEKLKPFLDALASQDFSSKFATILKEKSKEGLTP